MRIVRVVVGLLVLPAFSAPLEGRSTPAGQAISPGEPDSVSRIEDRCPTFLWTPATDARAVEVLIYEWESDRLTAPQQEASEVSSKRLPPGASGWTPSLDACLEAGRRYAWLVRAEGETGDSTWSEPRFFEVSDAPSPAEVREALRVLRRYLDANSGEVAPISAPRLLENLAAPTPQGTVEAAAATKAPLQVANENVLFGLERKKKTGNICPSNYYCVEEILCPSGKKALSGGIELPPGGFISGFSILASYPRENAKIWSALVLNSGSDPISWNLHAMCARPD